MAKDEDRARPVPETRDAKLAEALRANLRRRKQAAQPAPAPKPDGSSTS